jgi:hypothetical protein
MGAVNDLLIDFCERVYPSDPEEAQRLEREIMNSAPLTIDQFRRIYEDTGWAAITLEQMQEAIDRDVARINPDTPVVEHKRKNVVPLPRTF